MLFLLLHIDNERYALESQQVVEVLPLVVLKTLPYTPEYFAGVFNYRGRIVPIIDLCQLIRGKRCSEHLSTRIILINYKVKQQADSSPSQTPYLLGLMAERVVETLHKSETELVDPNIQIDAAPYLGKMIVDEQGIIQCVHVDALLSDVEQVHLLQKLGV
ncbi:chemotaxis protein CheW [Pelatocladus sp. BLCC-F211]|uniref:chemotaxis protein CheW n=1 Tax=Pelatocladus sp. BLCC-F211 TaxID=3342752 RepID=UPI0035B7780C